MKKSKGHHKDGAVKEFRRWQALRRRSLPRRKASREMEVLHRNGNIKAVGKYVDGVLDGNFGSGCARTASRFKQGQLSPASRSAPGSAITKTGSSGTKAHTTTARKSASGRCSTRRVSSTSARSSSQRSKFQPPYNQDSLVRNRFTPILGYSRRSSPTWRVISMFLVRQIWCLDLEHRQ